jgi:HemY protein
MARIEAAEHGDTGRAREWMARAVHAAHDPAWTADGVIAENWMPASPVTGRLDAFQWRVPLADLTPRGPLIDLERPAEPARPVVVPIPPAVTEPVAVMAPAPAAPVPITQEPELQLAPEAKPVPKLNGPIDVAPVHLPDDPGPTAPEPGLDPVPKPGSEFPKGLAK